MRRAAVIGIVSGLVASLVSVTPSSAAPNAARFGEFSTPFREDGTPYGRTGFVRNNRGCTQNADGSFDCLPAAVTTSVLPDGRILYWNALEGVENVKNSAALELADQAIVDSDRLLSLNPTNPGAVDLDVAAERDVPQPTPAAAPRTARA